jgi:peptide/nickel transport system ATP-binding protein
MTAPLLEVTGLRTVFHALDGAWPAVDGVSFQLARGEVLGLVGESGSGKTVTGFSLTGLVDPPGEIVEGSVRFNGEELRAKDEEAMRRLRGDRIAMIFQDPLMTLNPVLTVGEQMAEALTEHRRMPAAEARRLSEAALARVGITAAAERLAQYPHEFSGGMRQRVAIATALLNEPDLIIADEPTTALDVTIQAQILAEMQRLARESGTALIWITHDLGVVSELADRIAVMYAGRIVEEGSTDEVLDGPRHPYTRGLLDSVPSANAPGSPLRQIEGVAPSLAKRPTGCPFRPRCPNATALCREVDPAPTVEASGRSYRCHHPVREAAAA